MLDLDKIRSQFPALTATSAHGRTVVHADAPGGTQAPQAVIDAIGGYLRAGNANAHGPFATSRATDELCTQVRSQAAQFLGATADGIVFGPNMTTLTFHFAEAFSRELDEGDRLVCTRLDHDANVSPWLQVAERTGAQIDWIDVDPTSGTLLVDDLPVGPATRLMAFPAASNALGTVVDLGPLVEAARVVGAVTFMDAVHAAPHVAIAQRQLGVDVVVCSAYKFFGPHAGLLSADPDLLARLTPRKVRPAPDSGPERWQNGTAAFETIAGVGAALDYLGGIGLADIAAHERGLSQRFLDGLDDLPHVTLHGPPRVDGRTPTFAVTVEGSSPDAVAAELAADGIFVWAGHYYAVEPMRALGLLDSGGAVRIGFVHYHGPDDVDRVLEALDRLSSQSASIHRR